jgi:hypothetical protein
MDAPRLVQSVPRPFCSNGFNGAKLAGLIGAVVVVSRSYTGRARVRPDRRYHPANASRLCKDRRQRWWSLR